MDYNNISITEQYRQNNFRKAFKYNNYVVFAAASLMLMLSFTGSGFYSLLDVLKSPIEKALMKNHNIDIEKAQQMFNNFIESDLLRFIVSISGQLIMLIIPALFCKKFLSVKPKKFVTLKPVLPDRPLYYVVLTLGFCYAGNMIFSMLSGRFSEVAQNLSLLPVLSSFISTVIIAPIFEEILFRGALLQSLLPFNKIYAITASAFLFGTLHGQINMIVNALIFGIMIGIGFSKTKSLFICIFIHMLNNGLSFLTSLLISNANTVFYVIAFSIFIFIAIGCTIAFVIDITVSGKRSVLYLEDEKTNLPRFNRKYLVKAWFANPFFWLFMLLLPLRLSF
ncbi:CPBP family intramembrane metalloprotease [Eubacteriales bacterium OttesenSCG-928-G02]|nr:CPBP family intramembrane metalloprotease [Eubacteriales bacterium OttesenSCG-928-G02]